MDRESERGGGAAVVVVDEGRRVIERRGDLLRHRRRWLRGDATGWFTGLQRWGAQLSGTGKGLLRLYTYTKACGRYRDAPSVVSTKVPLVKLPVNDILDPVSLHFAKNAFHVL